LGSLVAKSLVSLSDHGEVVRYRLLESVRLYAEQKLVETGELEQLRSAHRDFYLEWIESVPPDQMRCNFPILGLSPVEPLVPEADNLTMALEWCRQQERYELCARIAVRMTIYWIAFVRLGELMAWGRDLDAGLPAEDRDHRAMAYVLLSRAAWLAGELNEFNVYSARASALANPHSWVGALAQYVQAIYWGIMDPPRSDPFFQRAFEIEADMGITPDPVAYADFYLSRLRRANSRDEALALLNDWRANLGDATPSPAMAAVFALYGDIRTALELTSRAEPADVPIVRFVDELSRAVLASAQGHFDEAEQHLATLTSVGRDFAIPRGEVACLIGFSKVAVDRGDYPRASRLLAAIRSNVGQEDRRFRTNFEVLVYVHCTGVLRDVLDPETARTTQAEGAALTLKEALEAELIRTGATAGANPTD
jgi:hypothetical protein